MNVTHLKYAVEVARTGSITRAAENLYMGQPNLSKAIRELENSLGFQVFKRSPAGVEPTARGGEFLLRARELLARIEEMDGLYGPGGPNAALRIATPGADYVSCAFAAFIKEAGEAALGCTLAVTEAAEAVSGLGDGEYDLAVIRFEAGRAGEYLKAIDERGLKSELLWEYDCLVATSENNPFAENGNFAEGIELCAGPGCGEAGRRIFVRDRAALPALLCSVPGTYLWSPPLIHETLQRYGLVQLASPKGPRMQDMLLLGAAGDKTASLAAHIRRIRDEMEAAS